MSLGVSVTVGVALSVAVAVGLRIVRPVIGVNGPAVPPMVVPDTCQVKFPVDVMMLTPDCTPVTVRLSVQVPEKPERVPVAEVPLVVKVAPAQFAPTAGIAAEPVKFEGKLSVKGLMSRPIPLRLVMAKLSVDVPPNGIVVGLKLTEIVGG